MTTDNKTLADVQPGGRVRLGDQAELDRLEFQAWARSIGACVDADEHGNYVDAHLNSAKLGWNAALSAQPSPVAYHGDVDLKWLSGSIGEVAHRLSTYMPTGLAEWADRARDCRIAAQVLSELSAQPSPGGQAAHCPVKHCGMTYARVPSDGRCHACGASVHPSPGGRRFHHVSEVAKHFGMAVTPEEMGEAIASAPSSRFSAEAAAAAFSNVKPSPGGQGDVLDLDRVLSLADVHAEESREDGVRLLDRGGLLAFAQDVIAALAARQPVSEIDAYQQGFRDGQDRTCTVVARQPGGEPVGSAGFVISNGSGEKYMAWGQVGPEWVADRSAALWLVRRADAEALAAENEDAWSILPVERCALPPNGWACTLADGHEGPCPTIAAPPAQQPAQVYLDGLDRALGEAIDQRERYHEVADELADHIARITGVDIGEHSSANCPWQNAIEAAEAYQPAQAVDLDAVRALLQRRIEQWRSHLPADPGAPGTREIETKGEHDYNNDVRIYREGIAVMEEVLALTDSQAVGNG